MGCRNSLQEPHFLSNNTLISGCGLDQSGNLAPAIHLRDMGGISTSPENGTAYVRTALGQSLMFSIAGGSLFHLNSVDLEEYSTVVPNAVTVHFVGYRLDGSIVTTDFTTDGIIDCIGPLTDFQTFSFGP